MKKLLLIITVLLVSNSVYAEEPLDFAKRYIVDINQNSSPISYSKYWRKRVRIHLHNTPDKLQRELESSARMHTIFLRNGSLSTSPTILELQKDNITYTYKLSKPITVQKEDKLGLFYPGWVYKEFQITVAKEDGDWKIAGETFVGE